MQNKKIIIIVLIVLIIACIITNVYLLNNKPQENELIIDDIYPVENQEILKDTTYKELTITNISLLIREGISIYQADIINNTTNKISLDNLYIVFYENENKKKIPALENINLEPNEKTTINITTEADLSKTTNIEYITQNNNTVE